MTCHNCRSEGRNFGKRKDRQRYQCLQCRKVITDARDNTLGGMYTPVDKAEQVLALLVEGCSINTIERVTGVHHGTILKLLGFRDRRMEPDVLADTTERSAITVTYAGAPSTPFAPGQPYVWLPTGSARPNQILPNDRAQTQNWTIGGNRLPTSAQNPYLNAAAFAYPAPFTLGTLGRNTLTSPGIVWAQTSLSKTWRLKERMRFEIRWDLNNPYKHINFSDPNRTYNIATLSTFGRFTGTRGSFSDVGSRTHSILVGRIEW